MPREAPCARVMLQGQLLRTMLPMAPFACTGCGDCCRGFARETPEWAPERGPVLRLSDEPGLPLLSWEWQRLREQAAIKGIEFPTQAFDGVLDTANKRVVVMSYRLGGLECVFFESRADLAAGARSEQWGYGRGGVCSIYPHRPLACRAYPLVPMRKGIALSLYCPELVDADVADEAALRAAYGDSAWDAAAFRTSPGLAVELLHDLEDRGAVRVAAEARDHAVEARAGWPRVDLCDLAAEHGLGAWQELERRSRLRP